MTHNAVSGTLRRIHVVGTSGSGKTTLAQQLAQCLDLPHVELDALHWEPDWTPAPDFRQRVAAALSGPAWTTDGNYSEIRDLVWSRADTVVWLDYTLPRIMWQVTTRTVCRSIRQEELWGTNRENLLGAFFTRDSIIWYALTTYRRRRRQYPILLAQPEHAHLHVVHLRSPRQTRAWLAALLAHRPQVGP